MNEEYILELKEMKANNLSYFDSFYEKTKKNVFFACYSILKRYDEAEDIMQEVYIKFLETLPKLDLNKYELEVDENGKQILPENAVGTYKTGTTEVTYYYVEKKIPLIVHHYIEGTTEKVPLKDGNIAEDVNESGKEGENYTTSATPDDKLSDE